MFFTELLILAAILSLVAGQAKYLEYHPESRVVVPVV
jgi:hypothetical protein